MTDTDTEHELNDDPRQDDFLEHMSRPENQTAAKLLRNIPEEGHKILERFYKSLHE